jgi:HSP20 family protein
LHELTIVKDDLGQTEHCAAGSMLSDKRSADMLNDMMPREITPTGRHRYPVDQMRRTQADFNRLFGGLRFYPGSEFPMLNLWTSPDGAIVAAEAPGVAPENLDITIRRDTVTVRGNRPPEDVGEGAVALRQERRHGPFARTIVLPFRVDADKAEASFDHGIVTLTLPRPEDDKPRQIKVTRS